MHEEFDNLAALEAIAGATFDESQRLTEHCEDCAPCRQALDEYREAAAAMALELEPVPPRRDARDNILREIESEAIANLRVAEASEAASAGRAIPARWLAAAAVFFLALFGWSELRIRALREELTTLVSEHATLLVQNNQLTEDQAALAERLETVRGAKQSFHLAGSEDTATATASVYMDPERRRAMVFLVNLAPNDETKSYQLWIIRSDPAAPQSAGIFDVGEDGRGAILVKDLPIDVPIAGLAVTLEPRGGLPAPSGRILLTGKV